MKSIYYLEKTNNVDQPSGLQDQVKTLVTAVHLIEVTKEATLATALMHKNYH